MTTTTTMGDGSSLTRAVLHDVGTQEGARSIERAMETERGGGRDVGVACAEESSRDGGRGVERGLAAAARACEDALRAANARDVRNEFASLGLGRNASVKCEGIINAMESTEGREIYTNLSHTHGKRATRVDFARVRGADVIAVCCGEDVEKIHASRKEIFVGSVVVWDVRDTVNELAILEARSEVTCFAITDDGRVAGGLANGRVAMWELPRSATKQSATNICRSNERDRAPLISSDAHDCAVFDLTWVGRFVVSVAGRCAQIWDVDGGCWRVTKTIEIGFHVDSFSTSDLSTNILLASSTGDFAVLRNDEFELQVKPSTPTRVVSVTQSPYYEDIALVIGDYSFRIQNINTGEILHTSPNVDCGLIAGAWSPKPNILFIAKADGCVDVWNLMEKTHEPVISVATTSAAISIVRLCAFKASGTHVIAIGDDVGSLHTWRLSSGLSNASNKEIRFSESFYRRTKINES